MCGRFSAHRQKLCKPNGAYRAAPPHRMKAESRRWCNVQSAASRQKTPETAERVRDGAGHRAYVLGGQQPRDRGRERGQACAAHLLRAARRPCREPVVRRSLGQRGYADAHRHPQQVQRPRDVLRRGRMGGQISGVGQGARGCGQRGHEPLVHAPAHGAAKRRADPDGGQHLRR